VIWTAAVGAARDQPRQWQAVCQNSAIMNPVNASPCDTYNIAINGQSATGEDLFPFAHFITNSCACHGQSTPVSASNIVRIERIV
jgi:hypothetical protein